MRSDREHPESGNEAQIPQGAAVYALVARQPIYDPAMTVVAYELLYRGSAAATKAEVVDGR